MEKRLYRDEHRKMIAGVCAGLADYFGIDVTVVRVLFLATLILKGGGLMIYIILWIVLPVKNYIFNNPTVDYKIPPTPFGNPAPFTSGDPFINKLPNHKSSGTIIAGAILIMLGGFFLLDQFDFIPDWDFSLLWPLILIAVGLVFMLTHGKKQPWDHNDWNKPAADKKEEDNINDNPTTI